VIRGCTNSTIKINITDRFLKNRTQPQRDNYKVHGVRIRILFRAFFTRPMIIQPLKCFFNKFL